MSACYRLVLDSVCRSNHHRLAVLALQHLRGAEAEGWRKLFLKHRGPYLEGAKAPDAEFKDFKNHVLHVGDGTDWGGAREAAREWYRRTVRALREADWSHAAWCAGVMSHYVVDPVQPFHTGQTEEEGVIHRAAEWSFSKAFGEMHLILEQELGYPEIETPDGADWLERMIRDAAVVSNRHYFTIIDHYDFEVGRKRPVDGLDQELKDVMAGLLGHATVLLARVLDRAIEESGAQAPSVSLIGDTVAIALAVPVNAVAAAVEDRGERAIVAKQYAEFRRTGKVRETLSDDDRAVRALHAEEVLKVSLSSLDCAWPKEVGLANGEGADPRVTRKRAAATPKVEKRAEPAETPPRQTAPKAAKQKPVTDETPVAREARIRLTREADVVDAPSIGPKTANRLNLIGVKTVSDLLELSPEDAAQRIKASHINARVIRDWQTQALLACSVPELSGTAAQMLVGAGVTSLEDLAAAEPQFLADAIEMFAKSPEGERAMRGQGVPPRERIEAWISSARAA